MGAGAGIHIVVVSGGWLLIHIVVVSFTNSLNYGDWSVPLRLSVGF